jgi:hypothetical protein
MRRAIGGDAVRSKAFADFAPEIKKMSPRHELYVIAGLGVIIALALILFPGWNGVHPNNDLTMPLGHAWIFSPPPRPEYFSGVRVERNWSDNILIGFGALALGVFWIALSAPEKQN